MTSLKQGTIVALLDVALAVPVAVSDTVCRDDPAV